jgi:hypothetical protein
MFASTIINYEKRGPKFNADARVKFYFPAKVCNEQTMSSAYIFSKNNLWMGKYLKRSCSSSGALSYGTISF